MDGELDCAVHNGAARAMSSASEAYSAWAGPVGLGGPGLLMVLVLSRSCTHTSAEPFAAAGGSKGRPTARSVISSSVVRTTWRPTVCSKMSLTTLELAPPRLRKPLSRPPTRSSSPHHA